MQAHREGKQPQCSPGKPCTLNWCRVGFAVHGVDVDCVCVVQGGEDQWKRGHYPNEDSNTSVTDHAADGEDSNTGRHKQKFLAMHSSTFLLRAFLV